MSAFAQAWNLLKAIPGQQGYAGTLPPAVRGMYERARAAAGDDRRGDIEHQLLQLPEENIPESAPRNVRERRMRPSEVRFDEAGNPIPIPAGEGEQMPRSLRGIERDLSPLREMTPTQIGHSVKIDPGTGKEYGSTSMHEVPGYETMPEESFFTPRERRVAQEGIDPTLRRNIGGQQRGQRMTDLRHQVIGSQEGVARGGRITGASREFMPEKEPEQKMTPEQELAMRLAAMAANNPNIQMDMPDMTPDPELNKPKETVPRNENLRPMGARRAEILDPATMAMFEGQSGGVGAAQENMQAAMRRRQMEEFAEQMARARAKVGQTSGSEEQTQADKEA
jgi:hypothetical protein